MLLLSQRNVKALLARRISRGHFFLAVFFRVTHDGLSERGITRSLVLLRKNESGKEHARTATLTCMVLHNVCLLQADSIPRKLDLSLGPDGKERRNRDEIKKLLLM